MAARTTPFAMQEKPLPLLPALPSPTLTNPDMVLPNEIAMPAIPSSPRMGGPPSPSYLRSAASENELRKGLTHRGAEKEKRGLMSRKMMLLRSQSGSDMAVNGVSNDRTTPRSVCSEHSLDGSDDPSTFASSPILHDVGNLAPEHPDQLQQRRFSTGASSCSSDDSAAAIPHFLTNIDNGEGNATDDEMFGSDSATQKRMGYSVSIAGGTDIQRRAQEDDEANSAMLSRRAEQILANAKKRLNLMEGNLRGARDLVTPLTTANLKRATSLDSSHVSPASNCGSRNRVAPDGYHYKPPPQHVEEYRVLYAQASSPTMGREQRQSHNRGFSEVALLVRPHTALARSNSSLRRTMIPVRANDSSESPALRSSRSHDSLGSRVFRPVSRDHPLHTKNSPDPNLEPLRKNNGLENTTSILDSTDHDQEYGLNPPRSPLATGDLRTQMSSLKGKISNLKERAREDKLRRQSMNSLRTASPLNNATHNAPELWYTSSQSYGNAVLDTNAGIGSSPNNNPQRPQSAVKVWDQMPVKTGSMNAFAQQAIEQPQPDSRTRHDRPPSRRQLHSATETRPPMLPSSHRRTPSGSAAVQPADIRYVHQKNTHSREMPGSFNSYHEPAVAVQSFDLYEDDAVSPIAPNEAFATHHEQLISENGSVYEDAKVEQAPVLAHEDRDDAFDYQHFFLHSAMSTYGRGRRGSMSSEDSVSSVETMRGPTAAFDEEFEPTSALYPPPTPETPEALKEIERNLHKRTLSGDSVSTIATFATADEGPPSPTPSTRRASVLDWPIPPSHNSQPDSRPNSRPESRSSFRPSSRPTTAVKCPEREPDEDVSHRADSGVGLPKHPGSSQDGKGSGTHTSKSSVSTIIATPLSPPLSPTTMRLHDPATVAVNAMLDPHARQPGLKDKALLFGLIESLRKLCHQLQDDDEGQYESRVLRRRLDAAKRILDGVSEH